MEINVHRKWFTSKSTISELYYSPDEGPKQLSGYILEDTVRAPSIKIPGMTAIPAGKYQVQILWSDKFQQMMPHLMDVPGFDAIEIHWGNTDEDTDGCLLVGQTRTFDFIGGSRAAFKSFAIRYCEAINAKDDVFVMIHGDPPSDLKAA